MLATRTWVLLTFAGGATIAGAIAATPATESPPPKPAPITYVPIQGDELWNVVDDSQATGRGCLPFLAPLLAHPHWEIQLASGGTGCFGDHVVASFEVAADGLVTWMEPHMPDRRVRLTPQELATVTHLDRLSCAAPFDDARYQDGWDRVSVAGDITAHGGASIPPHSPAGEVIEQLFESVQARYVRDRRAALGTVVIDLVGRQGMYADRSKTYRVHIENDRLTISHGKRVLYDKPVEPVDLVKFVDYALDDGQPITGYEVARGTLIVGSDRRALAVDNWNLELFGLARPIEDTIFCDQNDASICHP